MMFGGAGFAALAAGLGATGFPGLAGEVVPVARCVVPALRGAAARVAGFRETLFLGTARFGAAFWGAAFLGAAFFEAAFFARMLRKVSRVSPHPARATTSDKSPMATIGLRMFVGGRMRVRSTEERVSCYTGSLAPRRIPSLRSCPRSGHPANTQVSSEPRSTRAAE